VRESIAPTIISPFEVELRLEPWVFRVKVWWFMIVVEHPDDDPEEDRYRGHESILPTSAVSRLR